MDRDDAQKLDIGGPQFLTTFKWHILAPLFFIHVTRPIKFPVESHDTSKLLPTITFSTTLPAATMPF